MLTKLAHRRLQSHFESHVSIRLSRSQPFSGRRDPASPGRRGRARALCRLSLRSPWNVGDAKACRPMNLNTRVCVCVRTRVFVRARVRIDI